jgi:diguanylate cyclase (GGDEF)-like protein
MDAIRDYDINDYKSKTELTQTKLYTAITSAIRSYKQICAISANKRGVELIIKASAEFMRTTDIKDLAERIIDHVAELTNTSVDGFVCSPYLKQNNQFKNVEDNSGLNVLAATSRFRAWLDKPLNKVAGREIQTALQQSMYSRKNIYTQNSIAVYFKHLGGSNLVLYVCSESPIESLDKHLLDIFSNNVSACLENVVLTSRMHNLAYYDPLTGLANRLQLLEDIQESLLSSRKNDSVLALIDIDHFAETNDALGHQFGDFILVSVGKRLRHHFSENCQIARIGNDIFALLGHEMMISPDLILSLFLEPFVADNQSIQLSATLGLIKFADYELSGSEALKDANIALKRAKIHHRSTYSYFTRGMGVEIRERVKMMHALRIAFDSDRLFIVYQPQINMRTGKTIGVEALLRWKTEDGSFIPPDQFIPIAEYSGLIISIGEWVLRAACFELVQLRELGFTNFQMAVNVSQSQFSHPMFLETLQSALRDSGVPPNCLELEITESMAMSDPDQLITTLTKIKQMNVQISIDDFGTGFSSLSYLQKLNVDKLKIDRAFVNAISEKNSDASIAKMIVKLSESLHLRVIAEGVETLDQIESLVSFGCDYGQGFYYSKPLSRFQLRNWLLTHATGDD